MGASRTAAAKLASLLLGQPVEPWAKAHAADDRSWSWIARRLATETDGEVEVSGETVRVWVGRTEVEPTSDDLPSAAGGAR